MPEAFSFNREFDFVRLDGLRRATGRPPHEWDIYILKELIDNALDADEILWREDSASFPSLHVHMEYIDVPERRSQQLFVQVSNRAEFPVEQIENIFATQWYTSRKAFIKGITRGALGNALKTLLGIPYALRNRVADDWKPDLKPLSILCNGTEQLLRYVVDSTSQAISLKYETKKDRAVEGTVISVGLDYFVQEIPRTLLEIELLAEQYHLCNPHAQFHWTVELGDQDWQKEYLPDLGWTGKFRGIAPVHWYSLTAFQDLLGALYRKHCVETGIDNLPVEIVYSSFVDFSKKAVETKPVRSTAAAIIETVGQARLTAADIESLVATRFYRALCQCSSSFDSANLGCIGSEHIRTVLTEALLVEGDLLYEITTDIGDDPNMPFVIEATVARLKDGKRQLWTAINFSPTYGDPFLSRWLPSPVQPNELVLGLRGFLDAYGLREDTPVVLFLHLICPNVEHHEFSKTEINHLPFKQMLGDLLDRLLTTFRRIREEEELRLEQTIFQVLDNILSELDRSERFVFEQLLEKLHVKLSQELSLTRWLESPDSMSRLQMYIASYQSRNTVVSQYVARPAVGTLDIPLHPDRHFSVLTEYVSRDLLAQHYVNKILYVQPRELEPVVVENGWLCSMDMALLRNPPRLEDLQRTLVQCLASNDLPVLALHNSDEAGQAVFEQMLAWIKNRHMDVDRLVDLGLNTTDVLNKNPQPTKVVEMMPGELAIWLLERFEMLGIPVKSLPLDSGIRQDISQRFERSLHRYLFDGMLLKFGVAHLLIDLNKQLQITDQMMNQALDKRLKDKLRQESRTKSYIAVLDEVVDEFFKAFMLEHSPDIQKLVQIHIDQLQNGDCCKSRLSSRH